MSPDACRYCERQTGQDLPDDETASWVPYAHYLMSRWQEWDMGLLENTDLKGFEKRYLVAINQEILRYRKELDQRRQQMENKT